ncbi:MAG TPA: hypothetical protein VIK01_21340 [Polyangiaceae bacterium]
MSNRSHGGAWGLTFCALAACQQAAVGPVAVPTSRAASAPHRVKPRVAIAPASAAAPPLAAASAPVTSPFVDSVRLGYAARLVHTANGALLSTEKLLLGIHDDRVSVDPPLLEGLRQGRGPFPSVFGTLPDAAWLVESSSWGRIRRPSLARFTGTEWLKSDSALQGRAVIGISAWSRGRTLALLGDAYGSQFDFVQLGGPRGGPLPQLDYAARRKYGCVDSIRPMAMSALPSGEVFVVGERCSAIRSFAGTVVESWGPGQTRGNLSGLPGLGEHQAVFAELDNIVAVSGSDVFVAGVRSTRAGEDVTPADEAYIAHFDGREWRALPAPPSERLDDLQRASDGTLWALSDGALWTAAASASEPAAWTKVPLPRSVDEVDDHAVSSLWVKDTGDVWVTVGTETPSYLLRTKRGNEPLSAPSDTQVAALSKAFDPDAVFDCERPTLFVFKLSRQAPQDADVPSVREAFRGHPELEGKAEFIELPFLTRRYLGVRGERATLQRVMQVLMSRRIPGVEPRLRCLDAEPTRTLRMDFGGPKRSLPELHHQRGKKVLNPTRDLTYLFD